MNIKEIQDLIKFVAKSGVNEVEIEQKDFKIVIKSDDKRGREEKQIIVQASTPMAQVAAPVAPPVLAPAVEIVAENEDEDSKFITVKSPMIGTFYRSSSPDKDPFVSVGETIKQGDTICVIEAMKLFNEIEAEVTGKIVKVLVDDSAPVQYDQPLFLVDPF
ncbi:MAG: acetyl-CoA carboxylase biotin carboxyl carrier protein [Flavobacteriales bacterium]|tara:strand:+ start:283 stop:765 length:483 start_codon:yes stop_codon:yes gene_type:complete